MRRKIQDVRKIAEKELGFAHVDNGFAETSFRKSSALTYYIYIIEDRIVGLLATENITRAFVATEAGHSISSGKAHKASLGIHLMWVHAKHRKQGIATKLLDFARDRCVFGYTSIPPSRVAFSSPTESGFCFARSYMAKHETPVLVYQFSFENE